MPDPSSINIRVEERAGGTVVTPEGEIGYEEATPFQAALRRVSAQKPKKLIVDLERVEYMNTPGLATLVEALQMAKKNNTRLVLCGLNDKVRAIFEIARLHKVFEIKSTVDEAIAG